MAYSCLNALLAILMIISAMFFSANAQISTPCTASMITSFTPCLSFVTGSTARGSSPTKECCNSLRSLVETNMDCTCLIITGNVPVSIPFINRSLGISLPRACKSSVPIQCKASGVPLPAPGPVLFGPTAAPTAPAPHRPTAAPTAPAPHGPSPRGSKAVAQAAAEPADSSLDFSPSASPPDSPLAPAAHPGIRPVVQQNAASDTSSLSFSLVVMMIGTAIFLSS